MKAHIFLAAFLAFVACAPKEPPAPVHDAAADRAAIDAVRNAEMTGVTSGKSDWISSVYAPDIDMMPPGESAVKGVPAVQAWMEAMNKAASASGQYTSSEVSVMGDYAVDRFSAMLQISPFNGGKRVNEIIKGVHVLKRQPDGKWLIIQDVWNVDPLPTSK